MSQMGFMMSEENWNAHPEPIFEVIVHAEVADSQIWIRSNFEDWNRRDKGSIKEWTGLPQIYPYQNL